MFERPPHLTQQPFPDPLPPPDPPAPPSSPTADPVPPTTEETSQIHIATPPDRPVGNNGTKCHAKTGMAGGAPLETWLRSGVVSEDELDCDEDELPPLFGELVAAVDDLLEELDDVHQLQDAAVRELLWRVLERVGQLEHFCLEEAGMFGRTVEDARDSKERKWLLEQERNFVVYCPREREAIAQAAIEFTVALWIQCSPDWEEPSQSVSEARTELVSEGA